MVSLLKFCILIAQISLLFAQTDWSDCGDPFSAAITFSSVVINPSTVLVGQSNQVEISVIGRSKIPITAGKVKVEILWGTELVLKVDTIDLCDFTTTLQCPIGIGKDIQVSALLDVPSMPAGDYSVRIAVLNARNEETGCVTFNTAVENVVDTCQYESYYSVDLTGVEHNEVATLADRQVGNWLQVGPVGTFAPSFAARDFKFGTFSNLRGSEDLISTNPPTEAELASYVWGISGEMVQKGFVSSVVNGREIQKLVQRYKGTIFVGYQGAAGEPTWITASRALATGTFDWTYTFVEEQDSFKIAEIAGPVKFDPISSQPAGWSWPTSFGRLNGNNTIKTGEGASRFIVSGAKTYCSCSVDACGNCGKPAEGEICDLSSVTNANNKGANRFDDPIWAIVIVAVAILLVAIALLVCTFYRSRSKTGKKKGDNQPLTESSSSETSDSSDSFYLPDADKDIGTFDSKNKPNYGLMALDDVLRENEE